MSSTASEAPILFQGIATLELLRSLQAGGQKVQEVCELVLQGTGKVEPKLHAFASLEPKMVLEAAQALDTFRLSGRPVGPLYGLPIVLSDLIETKQQPTTNGTKIDTAKQGSKDSAVAERLKASGAVLLGKTRVSELGVVTPPETVHPTSLTHRPGNSASGAAAAIAAGLSPMDWFKSGFSPTTGRLLWNLWNATESWKYFEAGDFAARAKSGYSRLVGAFTSGLGAAGRCAVWLRRSGFQHAFRHCATPTRDLPEQSTG